MACFVSHTTVDCRDAYALSQWWKALLGYTDLPDDPNEPGHEECMILDPDTGHQLLFIEAEPAPGRNRLHLDLRPRTGTRDEELARVLALGARQLHDRRLPDGTGWVVLADPEGNEFCVLRSEEEVRTGPQPG
ncbi:VOC family protein [Nocardioides bruguierae]|uniref:VOC family protein n=1 Tax=Nocardioides bruguierae TaxID=2945102 RepID=UPI00202201AE|nr:VOC family protein [Nocardioides bruguierae]MCL8025114.1 VOC family protein [Nocardioides bruguierae]